MTSVGHLRWGLSIAISLQVCLGGNVRILITNAPKGVDSVVIAVDGPGSSAPLLQTTKLDANGTAFIEFTIPTPKNARFRAVALQHHDTSIFPFIVAFSAIQTDGKVDTVLLNFAIAPLLITIGQIVDLGDGTVTVPVTFTGGGVFFSVDQIVNLWVTTRNTMLVADGTLFLAPLAQVHSSAAFIAKFTIPRSLVSSIFQVGYHALDFRMDNPEIPLFVTAKYMPTGLPSPIALDPGAGGQPAVGVTQDAVPGTPGTSRVVVGKSGRLVRVFEPAK